MPKLPGHSTVVAYLALFVALGGSAVAAGVIIKKPNQVAKGVITSKHLKDGKAVGLADMTAAAKAALAGKTGPQGAKGDAGATGPQGAKGDTGAAGANGTNGTDGTDGTPGSNGSPAASMTNARFTIPAVAQGTMRVDFAPISGLFGNAVATEDNVEMTTPPVPLVAKDLQVEALTTSNAGLRQVSISRDGSALLFCNLAGATCTASGPQAIPASSHLSVSINSIAFAMAGGLPQTDMLVSFRAVEP